MSDTNPATVQSVPEDPPAAVQPDPGNSPYNAQNPKKGWLVAALIVCVAVVLIACGAWYAYHRTSTKSGSNALSVTVANEKIPQASCAEARGLIKQSVDGDECYVAKFKVDTESIRYVVIKQSETYQHKQAGQCGPDCGGTIPMTRSDYIVRASGQVQLALPDWTQPAAPYISELTGCGDGSFNTLTSQSGQASFVQHDGDIGLYVTAQNVHFPDQFGNDCAISFKLTQNITNNKSVTAGLNIAQLKVHYNLRPAADCQQQSGSEVYVCYQVQAVMRDDPSMCAMTIDPSDPNDGDVSCVTAIAERRQDPAICATIQAYGSSAVSQDVRSSNVQSCESTSTELKAVFTHELSVE